MLTINLLPEEEKREREKEKTRRTITFFVLLAAIACAADTAILLPSYLFAMDQEQSLRESLRVEEMFAAKSGVDVALRAARENAAVVGRVRAFALAPENVRPLMDRFFSGNPGITITALTVGKQGKVAVSGIARTRADLLGFEASLRNFNRFDSVMIPLSDIIQDQDIHFTVQAMLKPGSRL